MEQKTFIHIVKPARLINDKSDDWFIGIDMTGTNINGPGAYAYNADDFVQAFGVDVYNELHRREEDAPSELKAFKVTTTIEVVDAVEMFV